MWGKGGPILASPPPPALPHTGSALFPSSYLVDKVVQVFDLLGVHARAALDQQCGLRKVEGGAAVKGEAGAVELSSSQFIFQCFGRAG